MAEDVDGRSIWDGLKQQIYLGDDAFVADMQAKVAVSGQVVCIPRTQRRPPPKTLLAYESESTNRNDAILAAYRFGGLQLPTTGRPLRTPPRICRSHRPGRHDTKRDP